MASVKIPSGKRGVKYREVEGCPGYAVGNDGSIWSCKVSGRPRGKTGKWRERKLQRHKAGYPTVDMRQGTKHRLFCVHRLVMLAFVGPNPAGMVCCHKDGNPLNNRQSNLRWGTHKDNEADKRRHGRQMEGESHHHACLTEAKVLEIRRLRTLGWKLEEIGDRFDIGFGHVGHICARRLWKHV